MSFTPRRFYRPEADGIGVGFFMPAEAWSEDVNAMSLISQFPNHGIDANAHTVHHRQDAVGEDRDSEGLAADALILSFGDALQPGVT